ncbi:MAG: serine/threonine protein kinase [Deltaproteobacteria bacterium]|nr:serine/threonine protein kinase [Deltaproteobacteria bacterium]
MVFSNVTDLSDPKNLAKAIREYLHLKICPVKSPTLPDLHQRVVVRVLLPMGHALSLEGRVLRHLGNRGFLIKFRRSLDMASLRTLAGMPLRPTSPEERAARVAPPGPRAPAKPLVLPAAALERAREAAGPAVQLIDEALESPSSATGPVSGDGLQGRVIDNRYQVLAVLGQGGMGVVYEALHKYLNRKVAIKVLQKALASDEAYVARFLREAQAVAALRNPHTITVHDFGVTEDGQLYFAMELLEGMPLTDLIEREAPVPFDRAVDILVQVCESLEEAHAAGILHRDLKPDNLFIGKDTSGKLFVTVLDFGIAKKLAQNTPAAKITDTGMIPGTPHYVSPEQAHGKEATPCSDLYAMGVILYEMLCGHPPFDADSGVGVLLKHIQELPTPLAVAHPFLDIHPAVDDLLSVLLDKEPARRPQAARELARKLLETRDRIRRDEDVLLDSHRESRDTEETRTGGREGSGRTMDPDSTNPGTPRRRESPPPSLGHGAPDGIRFEDLMEAHRGTDESVPPPPPPPRMSPFPWKWAAAAAAAVAFGAGLLLWRLLGS